MYWWNSFYTWLTNVSTQPVFFSVLIFIVGVAVAGALSAFIARGALKSLLTQRDREQRVSAISMLVDAATEASVWNSLTPQEQVLADRAVGQADIQVRLLPIKGSDIAANWAAHQLAELKRTSATFGYQLEPAVHEFRDRLIEWQIKPSRARKIFLADLNRWRTQVSPTEETLVAEQDAWVAQKHHEQFVGTGSAESKGFTSASVASAPSTETQKLLDDVRALEVRSAETGEAAVTPV